MSDTNDKKEDVLSDIKERINTIQNKLDDSEKHRAVTEHRVNKLDKEVGELNQITRRTADDVAEIKIGLRKQEEESRNARTKVSEKFEQLQKSIDYNTTYINEMITTVKTANKIWWGIIAIAGFCLTAIKTLGVI